MLWWLEILTDQMSTACQHDKYIVIVNLCLICADLDPEHIHMSHSSSFLLVNINIIFEGKWQDTKIGTLKSKVTIFNLRRYECSVVLASVLRSWCCDDTYPMLKYDDMMLLSLAGEAAAVSDQQCLVTYSLTSGY